MAGSALAGVGKTISTVGGRTTKMGWGILSRLKMSLIIAVFLLMIVNAVMISIEEQNPDAGVKYLGNRFLLTTQQLDEESVAIVERGSVTENMGIRATWDYVKTFWKFFELFFLIYIWIKVLGYAITKWVIWDDSKSGVGQNLGLMAFFFIQVLSIAITSDSEVSLLQPFLAFFHFAQALPFIFKPLIQLMEHFTGG